MRTRRIENAYLGVALGDSYGADLEFMTSPNVLVKPIDVLSDAFRPTDDTYMTLHLSDAVLEHGSGQLNMDLLGGLIGKQFVSWSKDPATSSTAPGITCMAGAIKFEAIQDWRKSGDIHSDGCGAVMRILPIAVAFSGSDLVQAAAISSYVTHQHPNAIEASVLTAMAVNHLLNGNRLDLSAFDKFYEELKGVEFLGRPITQGQQSPTQLAILKAARMTEKFPHQTRMLDTTIPEGDGGWRSPSCLGMALWAFWRHPGRFVEAIEMATRHDGDSDSVGAVCGMLMGADGAELPEEWIDGLVDEKEICLFASDMVSEFN